MANDFPPEIGKYKVSGIIAKGGMGVIYKAFHPSLKRYVVIKKMTSRRSSSAERFKREAQILLDLQSPYIVHLFDYFTEGSFRYMVEELVDGQALDNLIKKQTVLPVPIAMLILQDACFALKYAHSKDIVHRDIKPGNILISKRGEVKLADFGIASDEKIEGDKTEAGLALGTPAYMPPEQFADSSSVDNRADIYALGIMLYEMLCGSKPYPGEFSIENLNTIRKGRYIHPRKIDKSIPKSVEKLIAKMIKPKAKSRFQSVDPIIKRIKKYLKHYDTHALRVLLAKSVLTDKTFEFSPVAEKDRKLRIARRIIFGTLASAALLCVLWVDGFFHRTVLKKIYHPVNVEMTLPSSLLGDFDLPVKAFFFENDGDKIPEIGGGRVLHVKGSTLREKLSLVPGTEIGRSFEKNTVYNMRELYLKDGNYRVKIVCGPYVQWESFTVDGNGVSMTTAFSKTSRILSFRPRAFAKSDGKEITAECTFEIFQNNNWKPLDQVNPEQIKSGTVWKIRASAAGYKSEIFSLLIDWYQDDIAVNFELESD